MMESELIDFQEIDIDTWLIIPQLGDFMIFQKELRHNGGILEVRNKQDRRL